MSYATPASEVMNIGQQNTVRLEVDRVVKLKSGEIMKQMLEVRCNNIVCLWRKCSVPEAMRTWAYLLAGGAFRDLTQKKCSEAVAVTQVGNNEGMPARSGPDPRIEVLKKLQARGVPVSIPTQPQMSDVVEYSQEKSSLGESLNGVWIEVGINATFLRQGSRLTTENGWIAQRGAPLAWVRIARKDFDYTLMPLPPTPTDKDLP